jgi:hypothetical protein
LTGCRPSFGSENVFIDVETLAPGEHFVEILEASIRSSDVIVAIIGLNWLGRVQDISAIQKEDDFIRLEIKNAIVANLPIIPILVQGARMPSMRDLPPEIQVITLKHAIELSDSRWNNDIQVLIDAVDKLRISLPPSGSGTHGAAI